MIGVVMMTQSDLMSVYNDIATDFNESIPESDNLIISLNELFCLTVRSCRYTNLSCHWNDKMNC